jgi:hypothetical protein
MVSKGCTLKARYTLATVKLALSKYRKRDPRRGPRSLGLAPKENALRPALQLSGARTRRNPRPQRRLPQEHSPRPIQSHPARSGGFIQTALELLASDRYLQKGMGLMALTGRRPAEIFFSASFSLPREKLPPIQPSSSTASSKPDRLPVPAPSPTPSPSSATPRKSSRPSTLSGI